MGIYPLIGWCINKLMNHTCINEDLEQGIQWVGGRIGLFEP
jgi:hypothetical protein